MRSIAHRFALAFLLAFGLAFPFALAACTGATVPAAAPVCPTVAPRTEAPTPGALATAASTATTATSTASANSPSSPPPAASSPSPAPVQREPRALSEALDAVRRAILAGDYATADAKLTVATTAAAGDPHFAYLVAYHRAARFAYAGDFERAAEAYVAVIPALAKQPESPDEFWSHNAMMMIREAQGDPAAALAENDQATLAAARGTWNAKGRETLAFLKDRWHRAYLTRMLAEMRPAGSSARRALVQYAEAALADYRERARTVGELEDSVAILEAYFAALDGRREAALEAAKRVDPEKDDDVEDLYLVVVGLEAGGDHAAAEKVKQVMRRPGGAHIARAIMLRWIEYDAKAPRDRGFTPFHPIAQPTAR